MTDRLQGKTIVITAAAQGIGLASALACAREGARVVATDLDAEKLTTHARHDNIVTERLDVLDPSGIAGFAARHPAPDALFNCAGYVHNGTILDCDEDAFTFSVDLNVRAMYRMMRAFLPGMLDKGRGSIVNMASVASSVIAAPNRFVYGATKAAVIGMTKSVAADFITKGIRANAICPGTIDSPSLQDRMRAGGDYEASRASFLARQPMGRLGTPDEIANLVVFLTSDESSLITGTAISIDGGWTNI